MRLPNVTIAALVLGAAWPAFAQVSDADRAALEKLKPGESITLGGVTFRMNRKQAGVADKDGWFPAHSEGGGFDVRLPVPYNDFTTSAQTKDGATIVSNTIGGRSAEGARFMANCFRRSDGQVSADWAASVAASFAQKDAHVEQTPVTMPGGSGLQIRVVSPARGRFQARFISSRNSMCQITVEYQGSGQPVIESAARVFLDSFAFGESRQQKGRRPTR